MENSMLVSKRSIGLAISILHDTNKDLKVFKIAGLEQALGTSPHHKEQLCALFPLKKLYRLQAKKGLQVAMQRLLLLAPLAVLTSLMNPKAVAVAARVMLPRERNCWESLGFLLNAYENNRSESKTKY